jgi:hypothetical protein
MELTEKQKARFWAKVNKTDSCWLWTGTGDSKGYGQVRINNINYQSHRVLWLLAGNTIPEGHVIRHKCRLKNCVNPEHLETGTQAENMADMIRDGTSNRGSKNPNTKLTEAQVREIRNSDKTQWELAQIYNVKQSAISNIKNRKTWYWLD